MQTIIKLSKVEDTRWVVTNLEDSKAESIWISQVRFVDEQAEPKFFALVDGLSFSPFSDTWEDLIKQLEATFSFSSKVG